MENTQPLSHLIQDAEWRKKDYFLWIMMCHLMGKHPLPWHIEQDWSSEVRDSKNALVLKFRNFEEATSFVLFAEEFNLEQKDDWEELKKQLGLKDLQE